MVFQLNLKALQYVITNNRIEIFFYYYYKMDKFVKSYNDCIVSISSGKHIELELAFKDATQEMVRDLFRLLGTGAKFTKTINLINNSHSKESQIKSIEYLDDKKTISFQKKRQIHDPVIANRGALLNKFKLAIESNNHSGLFASSSTLIRMKHRASVDNAFDGFRMDLTATIHLTGTEVDSIRELKPKIFAPFENIISNDYEFTSALGWEIEFEFCGDGEITTQRLINLRSHIIGLINPNHLQELAYEREIIRLSKDLFPQTMKVKYNLKLLLPAAIDLNKMDYSEIYPPVGYLLTDKIDGKRAVAILRGNKLVVLTTIYTEYIKDNITAMETTIVDCELIDGELWLFDLMMLEGKSFLNVPAYERIANLPAAAIIIGKFVKAQAKRFEILADDIPNLRRAITSFDKSSYTTDGLILIEPGKPYFKTITRKWKPNESNTIDFLVTQHIAGEYHLYVGISQQMFYNMNLQQPANYSATRSYFPIRFQPSNRPNAYIFKSERSELDGHICEMHWKDNTWNVVRIREDREKLLSSGKYYGNDFAVAELIWLNYSDPLTKDELINGPVGNYFAKKKDTKYQAQTAFMSFVKGHIISQISRSNWVIDIGIGKGQDLGRYINSNVYNLIGIDVDASALAELVRRKYQFMKKNVTANIKTNLFAVQANINLPYSVTIDRLVDIPTFHQADVIICNLAAHYFMGSVERINNFITLVEQLLKKNGSFIMTVLDGERVFKLLSDGKWSIDDGKFIIDKRYTSSKLESAGQKIGVLLPFANEFYEENLVNIPFFISQAEKRGLTNVAEWSFLDKLPEFSSNRQILSSSDKEWISLFSVIEFVKL